MTALANRAYVATGTTYANMDTGLLAMYDALSEATEKPELDIASASTCDIGSMASAKLRVTGGDTINSFGTVYRGPILLRMMGSLMIVNNRPTMWCPGGLNLFTSPGDVLIAWPKASTSGTSDGWIVMVLMRGTNILGPLEGGTGQSTLPAAFNAMKQQGSSSATGVWEAATDAEAQAGTDATRCVTPDNLGAVVIGLGQSWQTPARSLGVTYTNSAGRAILVNYAGTVSTTAFLTATVAGSSCGFSNTATAGNTASITGVLVPNGATYSINLSAGTISSSLWTELR